MGQSGGWSRLREALLGRAGRAGLVLTAAALLTPLGCGSDMDSAAMLAPREYLLGGQTGSLIPGCGVAPLSAEGRAVPAGDALAIVYAGDCPEQVAALGSVMLGASDANTVPVELVPLDEDGAFLVRAEQSLPAGEYQLSLGTDEGGALRVEAEAPAVPAALGPLRRRDADTCPERLEFELTLDAAALAYAPLTRYTLRLDDGSEQLWVDFGALRVESGADGPRGVLELPRCGSSGCLEGGPHRLELGAVIAGETLQPEPVEIQFELGCAPTPDASSSSGCALGGEPGSSSSAARAVGVSLLTWLTLRRARRRSTAARRT